MVYIVMQLVVSKNKLTASLFSVTVSCQHQTNIITWGSLFNYKQKVTLNIIIII